MERSLDGIMPRPKTRLISCEKLQCDDCTVLNCCGDSCILLPANGSVNVKVWQNSTEKSVLSHNVEVLGDYKLSSDKLLCLGKGTQFILYGEQGAMYYKITYSCGDEFNLRLQFDLCELPALLQLANLLFSYCKSGEYPPAMADHVLSLMLGELLVMQTRDKVYEEKGFDDICRWIRQNINRPITVADVARYFGYNADYLSRIFSESYAEGIKQYIIRERINYAKYLLLTTSLPIKEIGAQMGFSDYKQFLNFFTYHESMTPTKLRRLFMSVDFNKV